MIHQPMGGFSGQASDVAIHAQEIIKIKDNLNQLLANHTGQEKSKLEADTDRDNFLSAVEAKEYGIIDKVLSSRTQIEEVTLTNPVK